MAGLRAGASQYARLPVRDEELRLLIEATNQRKPKFGINQLLKPADKVTGEELVGSGPVMEEIQRQIRLAAATDIPVLIEGETGTGKDLVASAIHSQSARRDGPFVAVNLGAIPRELVGSELFGHIRGAFTGAVEARVGRFEQGQNGTVFLDEIPTLDAGSQVALLRLLEEKRFTRLGGRKQISPNARVIAATNADLRALVAKGEFREDLYFRLDVFHLILPPLRDRGEDIRELVDSFALRYSEQFGRSIRRIQPECYRALQNYGWPGNVRELKNAVQRAVLFCDGPNLSPRHLPERIRRGDARRSASTVTIRVGTPLREVERTMIVHSLAQVGQNRSEAARLLGISRRALYNKMKRYGIT
jgi:DNA-binding NtrC family response regulator